MQRISRDVYLMRRGTGFDPTARSLMTGIRFCPNVDRGPMPEIILALAEYVAFLKLLYQISSMIEVIGIPRLTKAFLALPTRSNLGSYSQPGPAISLLSQFDLSEALCYQTSEISI